MLEVEDENGVPFITQEEYDAAIAEVDEGLKFKQGNFSEKSDLSFLEVEAINEVIEDLMEEHDVDYESSLYNEYTTMDIEYIQLKILTYKTEWKKST